MTVTELFDLIANGENSGVEFKEDTLEARSLAKEVVAFANLEGGYILLGVDDSGSVVGISRPDLEGWVMNVCRDRVRPGIIPYYEVLRDVAPGRDVAIVHVSAGYTVHALWERNQLRYYIRVGSQCRDPSTDELSRLFQGRGAFRAELRPVSGTTLADLDLRRFRDYFVRVREQSVPDDNDASGWQTLLANTELMADEHEGFACNVAGLLLFGRNVNRYLPHAGIDAAAYPGTEKDYASTERSALRGPMTPLNAGNDLVENGLVEQALDFVRRNTRVEGALTTGGQRVERRLFPDAAVREAVVNALVHRDYLLSATDIELSIYSDRLEVTSPGRLPNDVTVDRMLAGCRAARNQMLKEVMRDYRYLEHMGMGVPRKIVRGMLEHNGKLPELVLEDERFTVRLLA